MNAWGGFSGNERKTDRYMIEPWIVMSPITPVDVSASTVIHTRTLIIRDRRKKLCSSNKLFASLCIF